MTKFRSERQVLFGLAVLLVLSGCASKSGVPVSGTVGADVAYAYIPLKRPIFWSESDAGGVALGNGVAVTVAHAEKMLDPAIILGVSTDYDLLFFRTDRTRAVLQEGELQLGQKVVAYAHYEAAPYQAEGVITRLEAPVEARCEVCAIQSAFVFKGNAGPGYSGGPVLDAGSGKLLGIVFGYLDQPKGERAIYAYPMSRVWAEWAKIKKAK